MIPNHLRERRAPRSMGEAFGPYSHARFPRARRGLLQVVLDLTARLFRYPII